MSRQSPLVAVPNVSEGRDSAIVEAIGEAFADAGARLLDVHVDPDHHRSVYTLAGEPGALAPALLAGIATAIELVDIRDGRGQHPHVGAVDVAPIVYLDPVRRGAACAETLLLADLLGERLQLPVLLYGELADGRTRAQLRRGGPRVLAQRIAAGEVRPHFGPARLHLSAGATLLTARPPLVAFNLELAPPAGLVEAREIAALVREGGREGIAGLRAIGIALHKLPGIEIGRAPPSSEADKGLPGIEIGRAPPSSEADKGLPGIEIGRAPPSSEADKGLPGIEIGRAPPSSEADKGLPGIGIGQAPPTSEADQGLPGIEIGQVSMNVENPFELPLREVVEAVERLARDAGTEIAAAELVGLAPRAAFEGFPEHLPLRNFDPARHLLENVLA